MNDIFHVMLLFRTSDDDKVTENRLHNVVGLLLLHLGKYGVMWLTVIMTAVNQLMMLNWNAK